jgi:hypothetical protein
LLARTYYRLGDTSSAHVFFNSTPASAFDDDANYEFGQVLFSLQKYPEALERFKKIPQSHHMFDLAGYYGAICAIKTKNYETAEELIDNAVVLPDRLMRSRNLYKKHISSVLVNKEKKLIEGPRKRTPKKPEPVRSITQTPSSKLPPKTETPPPTPEIDYSWVEKPEKSALLGLTNRNQKLNYNGKRTEDVRSHINYFSFNNGLIIPFEPRLRVPYLGLQVNSFIEDANHRGREVDVDPTPDENLRYLTARDDEGSENNGFLKLTLNAYLPTSENLTVGVGSSLSSLFPELDSDKQLENRDLYGLGILRVGPHDLRFFSHIIDTRDAEKKSLFVQTRQDLNYSATLPADFRLIGTLAVSRFTYQQENINGPESNLRATGGIASRFPLNFEMGLLGSYGLSKAETLYDSASENVYVFDKTVTGGEVYLSANPWQFISFKVGTIRERSAFSNIEPADEASVDELHNLLYNFISEVYFSGSLNLFF